MISDELAFYLRCYLNGERWVDITEEDENV